MQRQRRSFQRSLLSFIAIVLGILLAIMLSVTVYFQKMLDRVNYIDTKAPFPTAEVLQDLISEAEIPTFSEITPIGGKDTDLVNILLVGQDRREGENRARSDSMILCTFNKASKEVTVTSFLRDLYVTIPEYGDNRINAAYVYGGIPLLEETLASNFGIQVDGTVEVEVDFTQFAQVIDLLGGVSMELRQDEADAINAALDGNLTAGEQWLSGSQALAYARIRNLDADGDFSRTDRQRKLVYALFRSYKDADLGAVLSLISEALPMITTDMSRLSMLRYAAELFPILAGADFASQQVPAAGTYSEETIRDMAVLVADMDAARALLQDTLLADPEK